MSQRRFSKNISNVSSVKTAQQQTPKASRRSKSPISSSKCTHQTAVKQSVSYGELQIVLENIQNIKQKASSQVKSLTDENTMLREEVRQMEECISKLEMRINKDSEIEKIVEEKWRFKVGSLEEENSRLKSETQKQLNKIDQLNTKIRHLERQICVQKQNTEIEEKKVAQWARRWNWAFSTLAGDETRADEIVWKIKHSSCNVWQLLDKISSLESIMDLKIQKIDSLSQQLASIKHQNSHTANLLEKALNELNSCNQKLNSSQSELKQSVTTIYSFKDRERIQLSQIDGLQKQKMDLICVKSSLQLKVKLLSEELVRKQFVLEERDRKIAYNDVIGQVCDESEDYNKVLQRLSYLQKFRKEYYYNVEKIQYLCKCLDN